MKLRDYLSATNTGVPQFAGAVGVAATTVWRWLSGLRMPSVRQMRVIHRVTKGAVTPNDLVLEDER